MKMSPRRALTADLPMLFAEGSLARTSALPAVKLASQVSAPASGLNYVVLLARFDPVSQLWRTSQGSLVEATGPGWEPFSETWPRSGMTRSGIAYQLPPLVPLTYGTGFGSSPTHSIPTPTASDAIERAETYGQLNPDTNKAVTLNRWVRFWPTPLARDSRTVKGGKRAPNATGSEPLITQAAEADGKEDGGLNPTWVEWLQDFPPMWTDLEP